MPEILALQRLAFQENAARYNDDNIPPLLQTLEELLDEAKTHVILKAFNECGIIGSVRICRHDGYCYIGRLIVHPDHQNRGLGSRLLSAAESVFDTPRYELTTGHLDEKNIALYTKSGYRTGRKEKISDNLYFIHMEKMV